MLIDFLRRYRVRAAIYGTLLLCLVIGFALILSGVFSVPAPQPKPKPTPTASVNKFNCVTVDFTGLHFIVRHDPANAYADDGGKPNLAKVAETLPYPTDVGTPTHQCTLLNTDVANNIYDEYVTANGVHEWINAYDLSSPQAPGPRPSR
jgi:hypothetical protein